MMIAKLASLLLLSSSLALMVQVDAMAHITEDLVKARTVEDLRKASSSFSTTGGNGHRRHRQMNRQRKLAEQGLEDSPMILANSFGGTPGFYHGVASGDPLKDAVIVWTRYTPVAKEERVTLELRMAKVETDAIALESHLDPETNPNLHRALVEVAMESDFIAKMDITGLEPGTDYVFVFTDGTKASQVGQTKTAPDGRVDTMTYAFFSCSHFSNGYFHSYDVASTVQDLDFWIHLGDYVYEYGIYSSYATDVEERRLQLLPEWEQISLQDHRNRMATYHLDEGLQNLRRRAPLIATWDDHETTNNSYGQGTKEKTGAENHQEVCPANVTSPDADKETAKCDRDEGDVVERFNNAARAYLEWLPIRRQDGTMGVVDIGTITQVISWGDMATITTFDTRVSYRSAEPTLAAPTWESFFDIAAANNETALYGNTSSDVYAAIMDIAATVRAVMEDEQYTMIGDNINTLRDSFSASKEAGQTWQIWATATALGRSIKGNYHSIADFVEDPVAKATIQATMDAIFNSPEGTFFRSIVALAVSFTPWNSDDYGGFVHEQRQILDLLAENTNNPITLGGDLHDGYGWTLYENGDLDGTPSTVNLVTPGVTSPGWGPVLSSIFGSFLNPVTGGTTETLDLFEASDVAHNPGLKYFNHHYKGFVAVKVTKGEHIAEFITFSADTTVTPYDDARARNTDGNITAPFFCDAQLVTTAGDRGSLERSSECGAVVFETDRRPSAWDIPVPVVAIDDVNYPLITDCGFDQCEVDVTTLSMTSAVGGAVIAIPDLIRVVVLGYAVTTAIFLL